MVAMGEPDPCREPLPRESRYSSTTLSWSATQVSRSSELPFSSACSGNLLASLAYVQGYQTLWMNQSINTHTVFTIVMTTLGRQRTRLLGGQKKELARLRLQKITGNRALGRLLSFCHDYSEDCITQVAESQHPDSSWCASRWRPERSSGSLILERWFKWISKRTTVLPRKVLDFKQQSISSTLWVARISFRWSFFFVVPEVR